MNTITNNNVINIKRIDNKLEQLHSLMNVVQHTLEMQNGDIFNNDIANLMQVGKDITKVCKNKLHIENK